MDGGDDGRNAGDEGFEHGKQRTFQSAADEEHELEQQEQGDQQRQVAQSRVEQDLVQAVAPGGTRRMTHDHGLCQSTGRLTAAAAKGLVDGKPGLGLDLGPGLGQRPLDLRRRFACHAGCRSAPQELLHGVS